MSYEYKRHKYTLGHGVYAGEIVLENGETIWVEYLPALIDRAVSTLAELQDALEYTAASVCEQESCNYIQIRSVFHSTTIHDGVRIPDRLGQHLTFTAARYVNGIVTESKAGHAYVSGIDPRLGDGRWYQIVELVRVKWDEERGSSQGSHDTQSSRSAAGGSSSVVYANGWYPDPWAADSGMTARYYYNGKWTEHTS